MRVIDNCHRSANTPYFSNSPLSSSVELGITGYNGRMPVAKTPTYSIPVMCKFPLFVALYNATS